MIRSYALTLSAISLRLLKYGVVTVFELPPIGTYKIVSVLGWTINLGITEIIIRKLHTTGYKKHRAFVLTERSVNINKVR